MGETKSSRRYYKRTVKQSGRWLPTPNDASDEPPMHPVRLSSSPLTPHNDVTERMDSSEFDSCVENAQSHPRKPTSKTEKKSTKLSADDSWWGRAWGLRKTDSRKKKKKKSLDDCDDIKTSKSPKKLASKRKMKKQNSVDNSDEGKVLKSPKKPASIKKPAKKKTKEYKDKRGVVNIDDILAGSCHSTAKCKDMGMRYKIVSKSNSIMATAA